MFLLQGNKFLVSTQLVQFTNRISASPVEGFGSHIAKVLHYWAIYDLGINIDKIKQNSEII